MGLSKKLRFEVFKRDAFTCQYCGRRPPDVVLEADHVLPKCEGGQDTLENLTTACFECNRGKAGNELGNVAPALDELAVMESLQEMAERRMMLKAGVEVARAERDAEADAVACVREAWVERVGTDHFEDASIRRFLDRMGLDTLFQAVNVTSEWYTSHHRSAEKTWKYFCGVCWTMIRRAEESDG